MMENTRIYTVLYPLICVICAKNFKHGHPKTRTCSKECKLKHNCNETKKRKKRALLKKIQVKEEEEQKSLGNWALVAPGNHSPVTTGGIVSSPSFESETANHAPVTTGGIVSSPSFESEILSIDILIETHVYLERALAETLALREASRKEIEELRQKYSDLSNKCVGSMGPNTVEDLQQEDLQQLLNWIGGDIPISTPLVFAERAFMQPVTAVIEKLRTAMPTEYSSLSEQDLNLMSSFIRELQSWVTDGCQGQTKVIPLFSDQALAAIRKAQQAHIPYSGFEEETALSLSDLDEQFHYRQALDIPQGCKGSDTIGNRFYYDGDNMARCIDEVPQLLAFVHVIKILFPCMKLERFGPLVNLPYIRPSKPSSKNKYLTSAHQTGHLDYKHILEHMINDEPVTMFGNWAANFVIAIDENVGLNLFDEANNFVKGKSSFCGEDNLRTKLTTFSTVDCPAGSIAFSSGDCFHGGTLTRESSNPYLRLHGYITPLLARIGNRELEQGWIAHYINHLADKNKKRSFDSSSSSSPNAAKKHKQT